MTQVTTKHPVQSTSAIEPKQELDYILNNKLIHMWIVQETQLLKSSPINLANYNIFCKDRQDGYGGVAFFVHNDITSTDINATPLHFIEKMGINLT